MYSYSKVVSFKKIHENKNCVSLTINPDANIDYSTVPVIFVEEGRMIRGVARMSMACEDKSRIIFILQLSIVNMHLKEGCCLCSQLFHT